MNARVPDPIDVEPLSPEREALVQLRQAEMQLDIALANGRQPRAVLWTARARIWDAIAVLESVAHGETVEFFCLEPTVKCGQTF